MTSLGYEIKQSTSLTDYTLINLKLQWAVYMQFRLFSFDKFRDTAPSKPEKIRTGSIVFHLGNLRQAFLSLPIVIL